MTAVTTDYNAQALQTLIDQTTSAKNTTKDALTSAQNSESYLKLHPEAGGDLASSTSGTVLGKISATVKAIFEKFEKLSKYLDKLLKVKEIYDSAVKVIEAFQDGGVAGAVTALLDVVTGGYASELIDAIANGTTNDVLEAAFGAGGVIAADVTGIPILSNAGNVAHSYTHADDAIASVRNETVGDYRSGKTTLSETLGTGIGSSAAGSVIGTVDAVLNGFGIDIIPDSATTWVTQAGGTVGGWVGKGFNYVANGVKTTIFGY